MEAQHHTKWNFWLPDEDRNSGWSNHCYVLQLVCHGFGKTPEKAAVEAMRAGRVPEGFHPDHVVAIRDDVEVHGISLG